MPSPRDLLAAVPIFAGLDDEDLAHIANTTHVESFASGEHILEVGEPGRSLFLVTDGAVQVHHPNRDSHFELAQFGPGDFFGEMALLNDSPRSATVKALTKVEALVLDKVDFRRMLTERPEVALKILEAMSIRVRNADEKIAGLTRRAVRDPLTGLLNKRAFTDRLGEEIARARRYGGSFSLILVDFDDFSAVNRAVGRARGDEILAWAGRLLNEHTRGADVPFRFEEDAFTILCPWTVGEFAEAVAARLSALIAEARPPVEADLGLTVATGTATCPTDGDEAQVLFNTARSAMSAGRT